MADSIKVFENSLREYLINAHADSYNTAMKIQYRYNNLKVFMEPKKERIPHFWVSVNISEACYSIEPIEKISGSMASDDRYVLLWASRQNINEELKRHWTYVTHQTIITSEAHDMEEDENKKDQNKPIYDDDNFMPEIVGPKAKRRVRGKEASDAMTGTGLRKTKHTYEERRKMEEKFKKPES